MLGQFGIGPVSSLESAPHVVVLVFDVTLRSFEAMLRTCGSDSVAPGAHHAQPPPLVRCYRSVLRRARQHGLTVFAALTHIDAYEPDEDVDRSLAALQFALFLRVYLSLCGIYAF